MKPQGVDVDFFQTTLRFRVTNISQLNGTFYGPSVTIGNVYFQTYVKPYENTEGRYTTLGIFLACKNLQNWIEDEGYYVQIQFKLCPQPGSLQDPKILKTSRTFSASTPEDWGYKGITTWLNLIQPCWMKDGAIMIEVDLKIEKLGAVAAAILEAAEEVYDGYNSDQEAEAEYHDENCCPGYSQILKNFQELQLMMQNFVPQLVKTDVSSRLNETQENIEPICVKINNDKIWKL